MAETKTRKPLSPLAALWLKAGLLAAGLIVLNAALSSTFFRLDLTEEGRYTLSDITKQSLDQLEGDLAVYVYIEGDFPPTVQRFQEATRTLLEEMRAHAGAQLRYEFVDPTSREGLQEQFAELGLQPVPIRTSANELSQQEVLLYPVAELRYGGRSAWVDLLKGGGNQNLGLLLGAEQQLEYQLISSIRRLSSQAQYTIGLLRGHSEVGIADLQFFLQEAAKLYQFAEVDLSQGQAIAPPGYPMPDSTPRLDVLLIAQPDTAFTEREKYELDQYLMRGGHILLLMDQMRVDILTLTQTGRTLTEPRSLNLDDWLFKLGFKVNYNLVQDAECGFIDAVRTIQGRDMIQPQKWIYFPLVRGFAPHPITRNVDNVLMRFASTIDTLSRPGINQEVLFTSSYFSRQLPGQQVLDFNETLQNYPPPREVLEGRGEQIMGLGVWGVLPSVFAGRQAPTDERAQMAPRAPFLEQSTGEGRMVVFTDGALILGNHSRVGTRGIPVDNATLLLNSIDWLIGDAALTQIRAREVRIRSLSRAKVLGNEGLIRWLMIALPVVLVVVFGFVRHRLRQRRYQKH